MNHKNLVKVADGFDYDAIAGAYRWADHYVDDCDRQYGKSAMSIYRAVEELENMTRVASDVECEAIARAIKAICEGCPGLM